MADIFGAVRNAVTLGQYDRSKTALANQSRAADGALASQLAINKGPDFIVHTGPTQSAAGQASVDDSKAQWEALMRQITAANRPPPQVYAPKLDFAAVSAQARQAAEGNVNPFYTKTLNDFLTQQAAKRQQQQTLHDTNVQNIEDTLKQTLEGNDISKARTAEDVATNQAQINTTADQNQTDTGQAFDASRLALAKTASTGGLGAQQLEAAQTNRNTSEQRQEEGFTQKRQEQELFKTRSFEDLARSGALAGTSAEKGKKAANFDLDTYIQNAGFTEQDKRNELEQARLQAVSGEEDKQQKIITNNWINSIADPAQRQAALQAYG